MVPGVIQEAIDTLSLKFVTKLEEDTFGLLDKSPGPPRWVRDGEGYRVMFSWPPHRPENERFAKAESPLLGTNYSFCASVVYSVSSRDVQLQWQLQSSNGSEVSQANSSDRGGRLSLTFPVGRGRLVLLAMTESQAKRVDYVANISTVTFTLGDCQTPGK